MTSSQDCFCCLHLSECICASIRLAPRRPDLSPADFFSSLLEACKNQPTILVVLKTEIEMAIRSIDENMLRNVFQNLLNQMNACLDINGEQFQHFL